MWSGWGDLNSRPLDPQSSALTKLRHSPYQRPTVAAVGEGVARPPRGETQEMTKTRARSLAILTFALLGTQVAMASAAGAQGGLLGLGLFAPPAPPPQAAPAAPTASTPLQIEQRLEALRYDVGAVDGNIDDAAKSAIMAFQKVYGLPRTGELSDAVGTQIMATHGTP